LEKKIWGTIFSPINYKVLAIYSHKLSSMISDPIKLPNFIQQPHFSIFALNSTKEYFCTQNTLKGKIEGKNRRKGAIG
jgi:hypothetical protein